MRLIALALVIAGCQGSGDKTVEARYKQARDSVSLGDRWSVATAQLERMLGRPQAKTELEWRWATIASDHCYDVRVLRWEHADKVKGVIGGVVNNAVPDRYQRCAEIANGQK